MRSLFKPRSHKIVAVQSVSNKYAVDRQFRLFRAPAAWSKIQFVLHQVVQQWKSRCQTTCAGCDVGHDIKTLRVDPTLKGSHVYEPNVMVSQSRQQDQCRIPLQTVGVLQNAHASLQIGAMLQHTRVLHGRTWLPALLCLDRQL